MFKGIQNKFVNKEQGFTLIELLVVIVIIGVLAAIALPIFLNQQKAAFEAHAKSDLRQLSQAATLAKVKTGKSLLALTGSGYTSNQCVSQTAGVNYADLPQTHTCWVAYKSALKVISDTSGIDVKGLLDPYGRPYFIDENEGEYGNCGKDLLGYYASPADQAANPGNRIAYKFTINHGSAACT